MTTLITFDIDGTLLSLDKQGIMEYIKSYNEAFTELFGKTDNLRDFLRPKTSGMTDLAIIRYTVTNALHRKIH